MTAAAPAEAAEASPGPAASPERKPRPPRVFVGLGMSPGVAQKLAELVEPLKDGSIRLVPPADIHLTLVPPWNESDISDAAGKLRKLVSGFGQFLLAFEHLRYGPTRREPRLLWAECAASNELVALRTALLAAYRQCDDERPFRPHVTLARIAKDARAMARKNPLDQTLSLTQLVTSVQLYQSPPRGPGGYQILASLPLEEAAP